MARSSRSTRLKEARRKLEIISNQFRRIAEKAINSGSVTEAELDVEVREVLESGRDQLVENQRKWAFLSKVYAILSAHWALTAIVSCITIFYFPIQNLLTGKWITASTVIVTVCLYFILLRLLLLYANGRRFGLNLMLLGFLSLSFSAGVGASCANISNSAGRIFVLELFGLTSAACFYLFGYTFLASIKDNLDEFNTFKPSAISCFYIFFLTGFAQIFFPYALLAGLWAIVFSSIIASTVEDLLEKFNFDDYVLAYVSIPFQIINCCCCCCCDFE